MTAEERAREAGRKDGQDEKLPVPMHLPEWRSLRDWLGACEAVSIAYLEGYKEGVATRAGGSGCDNF